MLGFPSYDILAYWDVPVKVIVWVFSVVPGDTGASYGTNSLTYMMIPSLAPAV